MLRRTFLLLNLLVPLGTRPVAAQVTVVDEGSFTVSRNGVRIGREEFSIRTTPNAAAGATYVAQATAVYDELRLFPALTARPSGVPVTYQVEVRHGADVEQKWSGAVGEGRVSARIVTARREAVREFLAADGALLLDDNVFHQYFFLARRRGGLPLPVIVPRRNVQEYLRCAERGQETIDIAGHAIVGAVFAVTGPDGVERQVWVDTEGRVLKVSVPAQGLVATRGGKLERRDRKVFTSVAVRGSSTAVEPVTRTTTRPVAAGAVTTRASTTPGTVDAIRATEAASAAGVVMKAGAAAPGPNADTSMS